MGGQAKDEPTITSALKEHLRELSIGKHGLRIKRFATETGHGDHYEL
jgi:hypothetical protein